MITKTLREDLQYTFDKLSNEEKEKLKGCSVLITGCAGFLGFYFMHFFYEYRDTLQMKHVIGLDNFMLGYPKDLA